MHSTLRVREYVFDTVAVRDAVEAIDIEKTVSEVEYTDTALSALFDFFCDWSPAREKDINSAASEGLSGLSADEREALFAECCDQLAATLRDGYDVEASEATIAWLANTIGRNGSDVDQYNFLLDYLWRFSRHLAELDPEENGSTGDVQEMLNATRNLPREYLETKENQYAGDAKVNRIRYQLLQEFHSDGEVDVGVLDEIKERVKAEDGELILQNWRDYTILGQIYYDYFKPRVKGYLGVLADQMAEEFEGLDLSTHIVDFQGAQNYLDNFAWIAVHTPPTGSQKSKHQFYLGIHAEYLRYGLHVGSNLREGDWEQNRDLDQMENPAAVSFETVRTKLRNVEDEFRRLEDLDRDDRTHSYFILQTGSDEWEDNIIEQYHFKLGNPGTRKLWDAGTARVVYLEDGELYATARIVDIEQQDRDEETHCFARIEAYEEFGPVGIHSIRGEFESSISLQHSIIEITNRDYQTIIETGTEMRYFWVNAAKTDWQRDGGESFYQVTTTGGELRRNPDAYRKASPGDEVLVYQISPDKQVVGRARVMRGLHEEPTDGDGDSVEGITLQWIESMDSVDWQDIRSDPELEESQLVQSDNSFVITELSEREYKRILELSKITRFEDFAEELAVPTSEITVEKNGLYFPDGEWERIQSRVKQALANGNHVLLFGPPGTGKTKLARQVCEATVGDDEYELVTASADWSTFDTVGGYQTTAQNTLAFEPGVVLDRFQSDAEGRPANEWLIIDELNRADIDKAFGSLFSALTGESVTLPFDGPNEEPIEILDASQSHKENTPNRFFIPDDWRMLATINTLDKTSLYEMSYAFMRRWAFIPIGIPELPDREDGVDSELESLVGDYVAVWAADSGVPEAKHHYETVGRIWRAVNNERAIGPAIVEDIYEYVATASSTDAADYVSPIIMYVFPQLEGLRRNELERLIETLDSIVGDDTGELWTVARDFFQVELSQSGGE